MLLSFFCLTKFNVYLIEQSLDVIESVLGHQPTKNKKIMSVYILYLPSVKGFSNL